MSSQAARSSAGLPLEHRSTEPLFLDGFETALIGLAETSLGGRIRTVGVYDLNQCFDILAAHGMTEGEAADRILRDILGWTPAGRDEV